MKAKRIILLSMGLILFLVIWNFDPMVCRVRFRFPDAKITDCCDLGPVAPAFLHRYWRPSDRLWGGYLDVELENQTVDLNKFSDVPFFLLGLKHCRIVGTMFPHGDSLNPANRGFHEDVMFTDCDFSGVTNMDLTSLKDVRDVTYETDPQ